MSLTACTRLSIVIKKNYWRLGMGILALGADERVSQVKVSKKALTVTLKDGRTIAVPLTWYPRLLNASPKQRKNWRIAGGGYGIHWPEIDEDLSTEGLLRGAPAPRGDGALQTRPFPSKSKRSH
jgi:hypothetical protein